MSNYRFLAKESAPWLKQTVVWAFGISFMQVFFVLNRITSAGRTAISQALLHCYHTPYKTAGKSLVPSGAVNSRRVRYMMHATSVQTVNTDKLAWCSTVPNCVILPPRCIQKGTYLPLLTSNSTALRMNGFWLGFTFSMLQSHTTNLKNMKAIILWDVTEKCNSSFRLP